MNCRLTDNKVVLRNGSAVSVPYNQFENTEQIERYNGAVLKLIQNGEQTWLLWIEYNAKSIEDIQIISSLRQIYHKKKTKEFKLCITPKDQMMVFNLKCKTWPQEINQTWKNAFVIC